jgi:hypothetical protein
MDMEADRKLGPDAAKTKISERSLGEEQLACPCGWGRSKVRHCGAPPGEPHHGSA